MARRLGRPRAALLPRPVEAHAGDAVAASTRPRAAPRPLAELAPRDRAGVLAVMGVHVAADGEAWTYNVMRRLSDLHVVTGVK